MKFRTKKFMYFARVRGSNSSKPSASMSSRYDQNVASSVFRLSRNSIVSNSLMLVTLFALL